jgi:hypothetical protein
MRTRNRCEKQRDEEKEEGQMERADKEEAGDERSKY